MRIVHTSGSGASGWTIGSLTTGLHPRPNIENMREILLMEEILLTTWDVYGCIKP